MQAIILAAGMGKRLKELTSNNTKCMVKVNGTRLIDRMLAQLDRVGLSKIIIVIGYEGQKLVDHIKTLSIGTPIEYVENEVYYKTNNIYSLYLARDYLLKEDTLLLESDLIFEDAVLDRILQDPYPSLALVSKFESWMDGTVVTLDSEDNIKRFIPNKNFKFDEIPEYYKTVNIYKFSRDFSQTHYVPFLEAYCKALGNNEYYEQVLRVITLLDKPEIKALRLGHEAWYEIDDIQDLDIAESIFAESDDEKLARIQRRFGGYWRYPHLLDFCYLVNPCFPSPRLVDEMKANFERLLINYPSGMSVNSLLAAKYFGVHQDQICVGNGAAELIKALMGFFTGGTFGQGKMGFIFPTFEEYPNRLTPEQAVAYRPENANYSYTAEDLMAFFDDKGISVLTLINPDNPSGNFIPKDGLMKLLEWSAMKNITLILDESFVDFADTDEPATLIDEDILAHNPHLLVVKSISKSFGVPGLRLGVLASGNTSLITAVKKDVAIWNINSFAEFYMQIFEKYKSSYQAALSQFRDIRRVYVSMLETIPNLRIIPSHANYIMCEILSSETGDGSLSYKTSGAATAANRRQPITATKLTEILLTKYNILIKDLSMKNGFNNGNFIRIAVKTPEENKALAEALREILS